MFQNEIDAMDLNPPGTSPHPMEEASQQPTSLKDQLSRKGSLPYMTYRSVG